MEVVKKGRQMLRSCSCTSCMSELRFGTVDEFTDFDVQLVVNPFDKFGNYIWYYVTCPVCNAEIKTRKRAVGFGNVFSCCNTYRYFKDTKERF